MKNNKNVYDETLDANENVAKILFLHTKKELILTTTDIDRTSFVGRRYNVLYIRSHDSS